MYKSLLNSRFEKFGANVIKTKEDCYYSMYGNIYHL